VQTRFLKDIGVDEVTALNKFHLAPLTTRRDIAMLGLIHRTAMGKGPAQFKEFFKRDPHTKALHDPRNDSNAPITRRFALGLVAIYNLLPQSIRGSKTVSAFQRSLQECVVKFALAGYPQWAEVFSPRIPLVSHPIMIHSQVMASPI
jgi:hypothetical protein